ncbi:uncharacterized protein [Epargyreus clarus]|uniref:uncharacterized protein n=1 Tax=Epargyreus clarus TaxID=520877 RepID=UPI003C2CC6F9
MFAEMGTNSYMISKDSNKYVISLDSLDLKLLPIYKPRREPALLWTANNCVGAENYYEFEIKSSHEAPVFEFTGSFDDGPTKDLTNTFCYICHVTMPNAHFAKHLRSLKHRSYQKIANIGLERVKKHKEMITEDKNKELEYFCEHCTLVMPLSARNTHENTELHKKYTAIDTFVDTFATFYAYIEDDRHIGVVEHANACELVKVNQKDFETEDDLEVMTIKISTSDNNYVDVKPTKISNNEKTREFNKDNLDMNTKLNKDSLVLDESLTKEKETVLGSKIKDAESLIKDIESRLVDLKEMNNNVTEIESNEGANLVSNLEQYIRLLKRHSTIKLSTINSNEQERLIVESTDGAELVISVNNFHGLRRTGNKFVQCKLCKIFVSDKNEHKVSEKHLKYVTQPFEDKHCLRRLAESSSHCVVCNEIVDKPEVHKLFNEHIRKLEQALIPKKVTKSPPEEVNECELKIVPKTDMKAKEIEDTNSANTVSNNQNTNSLDEHRKDVSNRHFCIICNKFMHVNDIEIHEKGTKHIMNSKTVNNYLMKKDNDGLKCKVCNTSLQKYLWAIEDHVATVDHVIKYFNVLAVNQIDKIDDDLFCKPCSVILPKMTEICHIGSRIHRLKLASYNIECIKDINKCKENLYVDEKGGKVSETSEDKETVFNKNGNNNDNNEVVKLNTFVSEDSSFEHIDNAFVDKCNIKDSIEEVSVDYENVKLIKIQQNKDNTQSYDCDAKNKDSLNNPVNVHDELPKDVMMDKFISRINSSLKELLKYYSNPPKIHYHLQRINAENEVICKICAHTISIEDTEKHINSLKHVNNYRVLIAENKLKARENRYICYACNVYVDNDKELSHIDSEKHIKRIQALKNESHVLITADAKKLIDKIDKDLKFLENKYENCSEGIKFGDFLPSKKKGNCRTNVNHHFTEVIDNEHKIFCVLCRILVPNTEYEIITHSDDKNHTMRYKEVMAHNQIFDIDTGFVCGLCECTLDNEFEHISSQNHVETQQKYRKKNFCFKCNVSTIDIGVKEHVTTIQHIKNINRNTPAHYYCNICDLQLTNNEMNVKRHNDGFQHKNNCSLLEQNSVSLKNKKCFCKICESHFSREFFDVHISSLNHIMLLGGD